LIDNNILVEEARRVVEEEIDALNRYKPSINDSYAEAVNLIISAKKLIVSGIGKSGIIGEKIAATFSSLGKPSFFLHPVESLHGDIGIVEKNDVIILLSKSGSTEEVVRLVPYLKSRSSKIIALVGNLNSYLARNADVIIDCSVDKEACPLEIAPTSSTIVAMAAGDALAGAYIIATNLSREDFSKQHPLGQIGRNITLTVRDVMHKNHHLPKIEVSATFKEAIIEISAKGLGCVCIVDEDNRLMGILTDGDVRRTLQKHDNIGKLLVTEVMKVRPVSINEISFLGDALSLMEQRESQISVLPVVGENNELKGVIRLHDIVRSGL